MKKSLFLTAIIVSAAAMTAGCSLKKTSSGGKTEPTSAASSQVQTDTAATSEAASEKVTAPEIEPSRHEITRAEGVYVYDEAKLLSQEDYNACNDYCEMLYEKYLINAAVVTASKLEGKSPYDYAAAAYDDIYKGRGSGLLLLINNDSGNDMLYLTGSCETYISEDMQKEAFYWATQEIVDGDYKTAALRLLKLGENCPEYIFDNAGLLERETIGELERILSASGGKNALLITINSTDKTNEQILEEYYKRRCQDGGIMAMIDAQSKKAIVHSSGTVPAGVDAALKKANTSAEKGDLTAAARTLAEALGS